MSNRKCQVQKQVGSKKERMELNMPMSQSVSHKIQKIKAVYKVSLPSISELRYELAERLSLRWRQIILGVSMCYCSHSQRNSSRQPRSPKGVTWLTSRRLTKTGVMSPVEKHRSLKFCATLARPLKFYLNSQVRNICLQKNGWIYLTRCI